MSWLQKVRNNPWYIFSSLGGHGLLNWMPDELYLKLAYRGFMGEKLDLKNPRTFNQKLQWLKLHDRNPLYCTLVDKYRVKPWVAERIGAEHVTKTYGCWERAEDIDLDSLPEQFVLKTNHDSGGVVICRGKSDFDFDAAKLKLSEHLKRNIYWYAREWAYKNVKPLVFAEEYLESDEPNGDLYDYKLFRFTDGRLVTLAMTDRFTDGELSKTFFDEEWRALPVNENGHPTRPNLARPRSFEKMRAMADKLGEGLPFVRVDFYESANGLYFGELTLHPKAGLENYQPPEWGEIFGSWIDLTDLPGGGWLLVTDEWMLFVSREAERTSTSDNLQEGLVDYKFYCFSGEPRFLYVSKGLENHETARVSFLTMDWEFAPFGRSDYAPFEPLPEKPSSFNEMIRLAKELSAGMPFVRADFFDRDGTATFSELTLYPCAGLMPFDPPEWDEKVGSWIDLGDLNS